MSESTIPVTVLTGFLGAGKTTLLNRLLAAPHGERIAVIENEFGATGIDAGLLDSAASTIVELANGCICCSVRGELTTALGDLLARRDAGEIAFDRLIIETTGLADPAPVVQTFFWDETLRARFQLDGVITLVDACHFNDQYARERVAAAQVAFADRLVITRADLVPARHIESLCEHLHFINARARLIVAGSGEDEWRDLLAIGGFRLDERGLPPRSWRQAQRAGGISAHRSWEADIHSLVLESEVPLDLDAVSDFVDTLIADHAVDLLRYKGILAIANEPRRLIFQGVHRIAGFDYGREWAPLEPRKSCIVLIGRALGEAQLRDAFLATRAGLARGRVAA